MISYLRCVVTVALARHAWVVYQELAPHFIEASATYDPNYYYMKVYLQEGDNLKWVTHVAIIRIY